MQPFTGFLAQCKSLLKERQYLSKDYLFNHLGHAILGRYKAERPPDGDLGKGMRLTPLRSSTGGESLRCIR